MIERGVGFDKKGSGMIGSVVNSPMRAVTNSVCREVRHSLLQPVCRDALLLFTSLDRCSLHM